jgi:hypothetical protein
MRLFCILFGLVAIVGCSTPLRNALPKDDIVTLSTFGQHPGLHPEMAAEVARICLRHHVTRDQAVELLGNTGLRPTPRRLFYGFQPSQYMSLEFDDTGAKVGALINNEPVKE